MIAGKTWAAAAGALLVLAAVAGGFALRQRQGGLPARSPGQRPELLLLTSLPIVFPDQFTLGGAGSPALSALQARYRVIPISIADTRSLGRNRLLLMAQPRAQPGEVLVELDRWVQGGGHVLLLADPALEWPSERPLGDVLRPPLAFADTGLIGHWGLRLDAPDSLGPKKMAIDGHTVRTASPGTLVATARNCSVGAGRLVARCRVGKGAATIIADADFLDVDRQQATRAANLGLLLRELGRLER